MLPREVVRQIRRLQIRARRAVEDLVGGEYHSVFKGTGLAFEEVREYQPGDDIRAIDWNVTARMGHPFIKRYIEERELTVMLVVDASASHQFGSLLLTKTQVIAEMAAVLAFSAINNNDKVGLLTFTNQIERYVPPRKGPRHVLRLIRDILFYQPSRKRTAVRLGLEFLNRVLKRRTIVFMFSDFQDAGFEHVFKRTGRHHDLIAVRVTDPLEASQRAVGLVEFEDLETGEHRLVHLGRRSCEQFAAEAEGRKEQFAQLARSAHADPVEVSTGGGHLDELIRFFRRRERRLRRT